MAGLCHANFFLSKDESKAPFPKVGYFTVAERECVEGNREEKEKGETNKTLPYENNARITFKVNLHFKLYIIWVKPS